MKTTHTLLLMLPLAAAVVAEPELGEKLAKHQQGSKKLSNRQDELAADVQQLTIEQTAPPVIELLREVEDAMAEASEKLYLHDTGGETIAAETEVIEKIYEAAKKRQQQSQGQQPQQGQDPSSAMLEMMQRMMGKESGEGEGQGQGQGKKPGDQGGEGMEGESDSANSAQSSGANNGKTEPRTVPKGAGRAGKSLPKEFNDALKGYNRGIEKNTR